MGKSGFRKQRLLASLLSCTMEISILHRHLGADGLIEQLERAAGWEPSQVRLELRKNEQTFRRLDPAIVVASVSAAGGGLIALINGLLRLTSQSRKRRIVVQDRNGCRIEIDGARPNENLDELVEAIRKMEKPQVEIIEK
jgi:hypothetical protein